MAKKSDYAALFTLRKDGRYQASYTDDNGKRRFLYDRDAKKLFEKLQTINQPKAVTFQHIAESWHAEHAERVSYNATAIYKAPLKQLVALWGSNAADSLTPMMIQSLLNQMGKAGYAKRTVQVRLNMLNQIYDKAIVDGYVKDNPCAAVRLPSGLTVQRRELPTDDDIAIVKNSIDAPFGLFAYFTLYTGMRRGEVLALEWSDIDFDARTITVDKSMYWDVNRPVIKTTKTAAGCRVIPLLQPLEKVLKPESGYIFGLPSQTSFRHQWRRYANATGIRCTPHQLRHAFATICYEAGITDKDAQHILGHASVTTTRDIYTHIRDSRRKQTADKLNAFLREDVNGDVN